MNRDDTVDIVNEARLAHQLSWADIASAISKPPVWTVAALHGQHPLSAEDAGKVAEILELSEDVATALQRQPYRTPRADLQSDPTVYRFHEALQVYGSALKELIHEEFGDGIMSAINFRVSLERQHHPDGDRVVVTFDGKFLPYQW